MVPGAVTSQQRPGRHYRACGFDLAAGFDAERVRVDPEALRTGLGVFEDCSGGGGDKGKASTYNIAPRGDDQIFKQ